MPNDKISVGELSSRIDALRIKREVAKESLAKIKKEALAKYGVKSLFDLEKKLEKWKKELDVTKRALETKTAELSAAVTKIEKEIDDVRKR